MAKSNTNTNSNTTRKHSISFKNAKSRLQPQFAHESDINNIMAKYAKTGILPDATRQAHYLDITEGHDFSSMQDKVLHMNQLFQQLPSQVRYELRTPEEFYNAFSTAPGRARLESLGVLTKKEQAQTEPVAGSGVQPQETQKTTASKADKKAE